MTKPSLISCQHCAISQLCLPMMLPDAEIQHLDNIVNRGKPMDKGDMLFSAGQSMISIFAIRTGCIKTYTVSPEGDEQITGFHLPGEIVGLDAINSERHPSFAKAMTTSMICEIPYQKLDDLTAVMPGLRRQMVKIMSQEIMEEQKLLLLLNRKNANERLAAFLLNLSARYGKQGFSSSRFNLVMTRNEIGNYLGLALETVSRLMSRFHEDGLIRVQNREIDILDFDALYELAGIPCHKD